jgi:hypothetical protein
LAGDGLILYDPYVKNEDIATVGAAAAAVRGFIGLARMGAMASEAAMASIQTDVSRSAMQGGY